jgi:hypothetical protein
VKYQPPEGIENPKAYMGSFSRIALERWLEVSLPLTLLTLAVGYFFFICAKRRAKKKIEDMGLLPLYEEKQTVPP